MLDGLTRLCIADGDRPQSARAILNDSMPQTYPQRLTGISKLRQCKGYWQGDIKILASRICCYCFWDTLPLDHRPSVFKFDVIRNIGGNN